MKKFLIFSVFILVLLLAGCVSKAPPPVEVYAGPPPAESNMDVRALDSVIIDWGNRSYGEVAIIPWMKAGIINQRYDLVRTQFTLPPGTVIRFGIVEGINSREEARILSGLRFATQVSTELKIRVDRSAASIFEGNRNLQDIVERITAITKVEVTGGRELASHWHLVETEDSGVKTRAYNYWTAYAIDSAIWDQVVAKYLFDVVGQIPDTKAGQLLAASYEEINRETRRVQERSDAEFQNDVALMNKEVDNQHGENMALINGQTAVGVAEAADRLFAYDGDYIRALHAIASALKH